MIAVDTNLLVYAHREDTEWHLKAEQTVRAPAEGVAAWTIPWPCVHEFLAVVTHPRIFRTPTPIVGAADQVGPWLQSPSLVMLAENESYWEALQSLIAQARVDGARVHDARVAALCQPRGARTVDGRSRLLAGFRSSRVQSARRVSRSR